MENKTSCVNKFIENPLLIPGNNIYTLCFCYHHTLNGRPNYGLNFINIYISSKITIRIATKSYQNVI